MRPGVRRALGAAARYRWVYVLGFVSLIVTNALNLSIPLMLKRAFDGIQGGRGVRFVAVIGLAILLVAALRAVIRTVSRLAMLGTSRRVVTDLREQVFDHLQRLPTSYFDRMPTGDIVSRLISDLTYVRSLFGPSAMMLSNTIVLYAMALVILIGMESLLTAIALAPYLLAIGIVKRFTKRMHAESVAAQEALARISARLSENLNGITVVKSYRREADEIARFDGLSDEYYEANRRFAQSRALVVPTFGVVSSLGTLAVLWIGGQRVMAGTFSLGDFVAFTATLAMLTWPALALGWMLNALQRGLAAMERLEGILSQPVEQEPDSVVHGRSFSAAGPIEFRHCTFHYPGLVPVAVGEAARPALEDLSFRVERGGRLGIVGRTGSGKSTILDLLTGLQRPEPGQVFVDGHDLLELPLGELRPRVGAVPQGAFVFSTRVRDNVGYGLEGEPEPARIELAVRDAGLEKDLPQLPEGLETVLGERGVTLSGGQRQRVTLARALAVEPELLLLDDSLSSVDTQTEREILGRLDERRGRRRATEIIVSHRLSAVAECDEILVLAAGRVIERGTHAELLELGGEYARTWDEQQLRRELAEVD